MYVGIARAKRRLVLSRGTQYQDRTCSSPLRARRTDSTVATGRLGGLIHEYYRAAA